MTPVSTHGFELVALRDHHFLAGAPLHDAWAVDLPRTRFLMRPISPASDGAVSDCLNS